MGNSIFGIEFAPLSVPMERRLQTLAVLYYCLQFLVFGFAFTQLILYLLWTPYYYLSLLYFVWFLYDYQTCERGGRRNNWLRSIEAWKHFANFFPIRLIKTVELSNDRNYIFGCHPHGILCFSHFVNFGTEGTFFSQKFPGLLPHLITLKYQFLMPFHREIFSMTGACSASRESIDYVLSKKGTGNVAALITGGALEVLNTVPNTLSLILNKRKGFVRLALKHGASLVPVISFGENDIFGTLHKENSTFNAIEEKIIKILGYPIPVFFGRGIFQYSFGVLPYRKPITTVVGKPIHVDKKVNPTQEEIDLLHQQYIKQLKELFEENKEKYGHADLTLKIK